MRNKRRIIGILGAAVLALVGTVSLMAYVRAAEDRAVADEELVDVYVVHELIAQGAGADVIADAVSLEQVPARLKQDGAITSLDDVEDQVAATELQPGDQLLTARLAPAEEVDDDLEGKVQISVLLAAERAVGGTLQAGDTVGVYLSFDPFDLEQTVRLDEAVDSTERAGAGDGAEAGATTTTAPTKKSPNMTRLEFQHVPVTNVQTITAPVTVQGDADGDDPVTVSQVTGTQYVVTLALTPEQSERLVFASEFGHVWLSNEPASVSDDGSRLVTLGNVYEVVR